MRNPASSVFSSGPPSALTYSSLLRWLNIPRCAISFPKEDGANCASGWPKTQPGAPYCRINALLSHTADMRTRAMHHCGRPVGHSAIPTTGPQPSHEKTRPDACDTLSAVMRQAPHQPPDSWPSWVSQYGRCFLANGEVCSRIVESRYRVDNPAVVHTTMTCPACRRIVRQSAQ